MTYLIQHFDANDREIVNESYYTDFNPYQKQTMAGCPMIVLDTQDMSPRERRELSSDLLEALPGREYRYLPICVARAEVVKDGAVVASYHIKHVLSRPIQLIGPDWTDYACQPFNAFLTGSHPWSPHYLLQLAEKLPWKDDADSEAYAKILRAMAWPHVGGAEIHVIGARRQLAYAALQKPALVRYRPMQQGQPRKHGQGRRH